jgi:hypothetical protein
MCSLSHKTFSIINLANKVIFLSSDKVSTISCVASCSNLSNLPSNLSKVVILSIKSASCTSKVGVVEISGLDVVVVGVPFLHDAQTVGKFFFLFTPSKSFKQITQVYLYLKFYNWHFVFLTHIEA